MNTHENAELLRFATAGSVDDGKSTLIGRLLYDTKTLFEDQLEQLERKFDLAHLTDGLKAEREQGITIDVAYRYFATPKRRFVIADCPGHVQYTRNAVTGFSTSDLTLLLVDVRKGVIEQTRRHAYLAAVLGLPKVVFCVNKLDLVGYDPLSFRAVKAQIEALSRELGAPPVDVIPISALEGDNITAPSENLAWYDGPTLLELLEQVPVSEHAVDGPARFPVQYVLRPERGPVEGRAYAGRVVSGTLRVGDAVRVLPSGWESRIAAIDTFDATHALAEAPRSVSIRLEDELDVGRGDWIVPVDSAPEPIREFHATVFWMGERPVEGAGRYELKHGTQRVKAIFEGIESRVDLETLASEPASRLSLNDIGRARIRCAEAVALDAHADNPAGGRMIVVDPATHETVGALLVDAA